MSALHDMYWTKLDSRHLTAIESAHETYGENRTTHHEQWGFTKARVAMYALRQTGKYPCWYEYLRVRSHDKINQNLNNSQ